MHLFSFTSPPSQLPFWLINLFLYSFQKTSAEDTSIYESTNDPGQNLSIAEQSTEYTSALANSDILADIYGQTSQSESVISDSEENEVAYIVYLENDEEMILVVSDISMKEKDIYNGR